MLNIVRHFNSKANLDIHYKKLKVSKQQTNKYSTDGRKGEVDIKATVRSRRNTLHRMAINIT